MWRETLAIIKLNFSLEWQKRRSYFSLLIYLLSTVYLAYLLFSDGLTAEGWNAFFWVIFIFAALQAAYRSFYFEADQRFLFYFGLVSARSLILGKILYNFIYLFFLGLATLMLFIFFLQQPLKDPWAFVLILLLAALGFSAILTLAAGLSAKAGANPALPAILSIPLLYPQLITLSKISLRALTGFSWEINSPLLLVMGLIGLVSLLLAYLLFPYLWRD